MKGERGKLLEDNLLAMMVYGGVSVKADVVVPEDETRLTELEMIFEENYGKLSKDELMKEAEELAKNYKMERDKAEIEKLQAELENADEEKTKEILRKITAIRKG